MRANAANNVQITGNTCLRSGEVAIFSEFGFSGALIANNIVEKAANGISVANFDHGGRLAVVANNIVRDLVTEGPYPADGQGFGVGIAVEADVTVSGNVIDGAPRFGLVLGWGRSCGMSRQPATSSAVRRSASRSASSRAPARR